MFPVAGVSFSETCNGQLVRQLTEEGPRIPCFKASELPTKVGRREAWLHFGLITEMTESLTFCWYRDERI